jgi:hypothetical protein
MQERVHEGTKTLWPYQGFGVRAFERKVGEGKLTLTKEAFLFEAKDGDIIGFDLQTLRLLRLKDVHTFEVAYSIQGELRSGSYRIVCTFPDGTERDELPSKDDTYRMSLLRSITGGVVARFLADHSHAVVEGVARMDDGRFDARLQDLERTVSLFPSKRELDEGVFWDENLRKRSLEESEIEPSIWEDPERLRLFFTGTNPSMTVENASEKLAFLQEYWANGNLSPEQRARAVACDYKIEMRHAEMGYTDNQGGSPDSWKASADRLVKFEKNLGIELPRYA